jgi:hypothetical protein
VTASEAQQLLLDRLGLRVGPEMAAYVLRSLDAGVATTPVIATDAKTGVAVKQDVALHVSMIQSFNDSIL